jgi:serine/threonine protein kinase
MDQLTSAANDPLINTVLSGRYTVIERVGKGSTGAVYKAIRNRDGNEVAIKVMHADLAADIDSIKRFQQEARAAAILTNQHIVRCLDAGLVGSGQPYLVTEFIHGQTLSERLSELPPLDLRQSLSIMRQTCEALAYAHNIGVMHCDIKPANIMLTKRFEQKNFVVVLDFSIARVVTKVSDLHDQESGAIFGTPTYMSPERCLGQPGDFRSDVYAMAVVMYQLLAGAPPFHAGDRRQIMKDHVSTTPPLIHQVNPKAKVPDGLEALIMHGLSKQPQDRPASMRILYDAVEDVERRWLDRG